MTSAPPPHETHTLDVMCGPCIAVLKAIRLGHGAWTRVMRELTGNDEHYVEASRGQVWRLL